MLSAETRAGPGRLGRSRSAGTLDRPRLGTLTPFGVAFAVALGAFGLCAVWFVQPGRLFGVGYDAGVYFGVALRLVHGVVPYRNFIFVEPPGIALLMTPLAGLARLVGPPACFAASAVVTALVAAVDAGLTAWLVRHRGRAAMAIAGSVLAFFPLAPSADHDLMLEPYLVLFVLLGTLGLLGRPAPPSRWRLLAAGASLGFAGAVKIWAVFPFAALLACEVLRSRRRAGWLVVGAGAGFGLPCLPFFVLAPSRFVHEVVLDQLRRGHLGYANVSLVSRLGQLTGVSGLPSPFSAPAVAVAASVAIVVLVAAAGWLGRKRWVFRDVGLVVYACASVGGLLLGPGIYDHYPYFSAPGLAAVVAVAVVEVGRHVRARADRSVHRGWQVLGVAGTLSVVAALLLSAVGSLRYSTYVFGPNTGGVDPGVAIARVARPGACVVADNPVLLIEASRFTAASAACPRFIDPYGMWLVAAAGRSAVGGTGRPEGLVATWRRALGRADDVVMSRRNAAYVPWTPELRGWFLRHFRTAVTEQDAVVYARRR